MASESSIALQVHHVPGAAPMKIADAILAVRLLPADPAQAITAGEFVDRWRAGARRDVSERTLLRWVSDLAAMNFITEVSPPTVPRRYYRPGHAVSGVGMSPDMAMRLVLSSRLLPDATALGLGAGGAELGAAESVIRTSDVLRELRRRVAVLPDGIGRLPTRIAPGVDEAVAQAVGTRRVLRIVYRSRTNELRGTSVTHDVSVQGVLSKDGTVYLVTCKTWDDRLNVFAAHRIIRAEVLTSAAIERDGFNLDTYIAQTHRMSFTTGEGQWVDLQLRVQPDALWHFRERPLCEGQSISDNPDAEGRSLVNARLPMNELLVPFLMGLGGGVEVLGPPELRAEIAVRLREAVARYGEMTV